MFTALNNKKSQSTTNTECLNINIISDKLPGFLCLTVSQKFTKLISYILKKNILKYASVVTINYLHKDYIKTAHDGSGDAKSTQLLRSNKIFKLYSIKFTVNWALM